MSVEIMGLVASSVTFVAVTVTSVIHHQNTQQLLRMLRQQESDLRECNRDVNDLRREVDFLKRSVTSLKREKPEPKKSEPSTKPDRVSRMGLIADSLTNPTREPSRE